MNLGTTAGRPARQRGVLLRLNGTSRLFVFGPLPPAHGSNPLDTSPLECASEPRGFAVAAGSGDVVVADAEGRVTLWPSPYSSRAEDVSPQGSVPTALAVAPGGDLVAAGHARGRVQLYARGDPAWTLQRVLRLHPEEEAGDVAVIAFSPDGRRIVTADAGGRVRVWEVRRLR